MTTATIQFPPKLLGETVTCKFDFISRLDVGETISTQLVLVTVYSGTDSSPSSMLSGVATASGTVVSQNITGGVLGVVYGLLCLITTSAGQTLELSGFMAVVPNKV